MESPIDSLEHLTELRKRIIIVLVIFVLSLAVGFYLSPKILLIIKEQPAAVNIVWNVFSLTDGIFLYLKCALIIALLVTLPVMLLQIWIFVRPGLTEFEAKGLVWFVPMSFGLVLMGVSFGYFVVFPMMVKFMSTINESIGAVETYGIDRFFSLLFNVLLPLSIAFQMPVVTLFLTKLGIINPLRLKKFRKKTYFILVIAGTMISPPDYISHILVTIPLILLYEVSIFFSGWYLRKKAKLALQA
ncbi:preprotein translocase subunit TatC [Cohnella kolymensis]|uniref:Sec-independent protein translocase protein TatC n=1 Tax=Cohnella kolymensis TaxID=1590652 RepID=A0ABR5A429_9BACL|nr:twin-arginine translocase subunit TatC [Cohnella kolymensis]KIL35806.1 preprotein translocase subunit TatC [Cohnella kolymensis]